MIWKSALRLLPLLLLPLPLLLSALSPTLSGGHQLLVAALPWLVWLIVLPLALGFKQGRLLLMSLHLAAGAGLLQLVSMPGADSPAGYLVQTLLGLIWPLLLGWILLLRERPALSAAGLGRSLLVLAPPLLLAALWHYRAADLARLLPQLPAVFFEYPFTDLTLSSALGGWHLLVVPLWLLLALLRGCPDRLTALVLSGCMLLSLAAGNSPGAGQLYHLLGQAVLLLALVRHGYAMAFVDTLTGVPGRRALEHCLISPGKGYSIAMLDIDHFKQFNDRYGHDIGDQVLRMVASQLRHVGAGGRLFRYGGEEFTIVFRRGDEASILAALEAVRERIARYPMKIRSANRPDDDNAGRHQRNRSGNGVQTVQVTISIGFSRHAGQARPEEVIKQADEALYAAKRAGRNCTRSASSMRAQKKGRSRSDFARHQG